MKEIVILALIGALIGLVTNALAIYLLFRPYQKIGPFQGLVPSRIKELAKSVGHTVQEELISLRDLMDSIINEIDLEQLKEKIGTKIAGAISEELPSIIPKSMVANLVQVYVRKHGDELFHATVNDLLENTENRAIISSHVEEKILSFDLHRLERIVYEVSRTELHFIIWLGGALGLLIGIVQGLIVVYVL